MNKSVIIQRCIPNKRGYFLKNKCYQCGYKFKNPISPLNVSFCWICNNCFCEKCFIIHDEYIK